MFCFPGMFKHSLPDQLLRNWKQNFNWFLIQAFGFVVVSTLTKRLCSVEVSAAFSYTHARSPYPQLKSDSVFMNFRNERSHASSWEKELIFLYNKTPP